MYVELTEIKVILLFLNKKTKTAVKAVFAETNTLAQKIEASKMLLWKRAVFTFQ
ncbi:hypothetical protein D920_00458 [Enterococcus faecalis 13-SD-W-01]|nr:hypothetical protein D920_00458 [Enterococcus faecalis 13-SD-W-01]